MRRNAGMRIAESPKGEELAIEEIA